MQKTLLVNLISLLSIALADQTVTSDGTVYVHKTIAVSTSTMGAKFTMTGAQIPDWCVPTILNPKPTNDGSGGSTNDDDASGSSSNENNGANGNGGNASGNGNGNNNNIPADDQDDQGGEAENRVETIISVSGSVQTITSTIRHTSVTDHVTPTSDNNELTSDATPSPTTNDNPTSIIPTPTLPAGLEALIDQPEFVSTMLYWHNYYRHLTGAGDLVWNSTLAAAAADWGSKCIFEHCAYYPYGENLALGTYTDPSYYIWAWYNEVEKYDFNHPDFSEDTGHFTQVVWKGSQQVGCAYVRGCDIIYKDPYYLICEYSPQGNVIPLFANNVGAPNTNNPLTPGSGWFDAFAAWYH